MDNALGSGFVQQTACLQCGFVSSLGVLGGHSIAHATNSGLQLGLNGAIAHMSFFVGDDAFLLALDVCHGKSFLQK